MARENMKRHKNRRFQEEDGEMEAEGRPAVTRQLPFETGEEYRRFQFFLSASPRSVREAYRLYQKAAGKEPKAYPPSTWFETARGDYATIRKANRQLKAIERAGQMHGRAVDWPAIEAIVNQAIEEGELDKAVYRGEFGEVMTGLKVIQVAFWSLAIDARGEPLPGVKTWEERAQLDAGAAARAVASGD